MKSSGECPKCESERVGKISLPSRRTPDWGPLPANPPPIRNANELDLERYVCVACGYSETYVSQPTLVDWDGLVGFSWHAPRAGGGPFR